MVDPALFHQRHQQRTSLLNRPQPLRPASRGIRMAGTVASVAITSTSFVAELAAAAAAPGSITPSTGTGTASSNRIQRQRARRIAGNHQELRALLFHQKLRALRRIPRNRPPRFRPIRQPRRIAQKDKSRPRHPLQQRLQHRQPAKAGVKNPNDRRDRSKAGIAPIRLRVRASPSQTAIGVRQGNRRSSNPSSSRFLRLRRSATSNQSDRSASDPHDPPA
jgi:hypothetical protein